MKPKVILGGVVLVALVAGALFWTTRGTSSSTRSLVTDYVDPQVTKFHNLSWLGAEGHPAAKTVKVADPDNAGRTLSLGGIVLRKIHDQSPLAEAGCREGDVLIKAGDAYLPNKEDPTLDLLERIEADISAGKKQVALARLRDGKVTEFSIPAGVPSLEEGYPLALERFTLAGRKGLAYLAKAQHEDGSFDTAGNTPASRLTVTSLAGLAFLGSGSTLSDGEYSQNLKRCFDLASSNFREVPEGEAPPDDLSALSISYALMFLAELSATEAMNIDLMQAMGYGMGRLISLQDEEGGWPLTDDPGSYGYNEATLATNQALFAIGMAERAGVMGPNEPIEKACAYIKARTGDGNVVATDVPGFDRRSEAGRSAGAGAALRSIGCTPYDSFLTQLTEYNSRLGKEIVAGRVAVPLHILNTAILRRQIGSRAWGQFLDDFRLLMTTLQRGDGSFAQIPNPSYKPLDFEERCAGDAWLTAVYTLALLLQEDHVPVLVCKRTTPMERTRDSDGKETSGEAPHMTMEHGMEIPAGAQVMTIDDPEELRKLLEGMGMDSKQIDDMLSGKGGSSGSFQVMTMDGPPPEGFRRKKKDDEEDEPAEAEESPEKKEDAPAEKEKKQDKDDADDATP